MRHLIFALTLLLANAAMAQPKQVVATCGGGTIAQVGDTINGTANPVGQDCVSASVSASISGFAPASTGTPISVTTGGVTGTLPAGTVVVASNVGATNGAYCKLGASATTSDQFIPPSSWFAFTVGAATQLTCITGTSTTTVNMVGGAGIPTGSGGGGGGSGGGGAVTVADGADVTQGANADAAATAGGTGTVSAKLRNATALLSTISTNTTGAATAAAQTTGNSSLSTIATNTTSIATAANQATANASLATIATNSGSAIPAGTAIIGKVGIDQTTPGTTNGVQVNAALPAGTNLIGNVGSVFPAGSTPITASTTGTTAATTATLAGTSGKTTYVCGFSIRANATAAATANSTVTGTISGTLNYTQWTAPLASGIGLTEQIFSPCVPASATNTGIAVISAAPGSGGVVSVSAWGFQL